MKSPRAIQVALVVLLGTTTEALAEGGEELARNGRLRAFAGDWVGEIDKGKGRGIRPVRIVLNEDETFNMVCEDEKWMRFEKVRVKFDGLRNNAVLTWVNQGGVWTETQTFSLSLVNSDRLKLVWMRHVNNLDENDDDDDDNETWHNWGHGSVERMVNVPKSCETKQ